MRLIAKKPCSFGGQRFFIGDEVPEEFVADTNAQEKLGIITVVNDGARVSDGQSGTIFTLQQVEKMIAEAVEEAVKNTDMEIGDKEFQDTVGLTQEDFLPESTVVIQIKGKSDGDDEQQMAVPATPEEIRQVFGIMQMNSSDGAAAIAAVESENVLILLHTADSRKTVKNAAKERADKLFSIAAVSDENSEEDEIIGTNTEGSDT